MTLGEYLLVLMVAGVGATVQGIVGFGANVVTVPVVAVVAPEALPAALVLWAVPMVIAMAHRERIGVDWSGVGWMSAGRLPGTAIGAWVVSIVAPDTLSVLAGSAVLIAVVASVLSPALPLNRITQTTAGFAAGVMGTTTSIGGPPMALLYQHQEGRVLRSTLAAGFVVGTSMTLLGLGIAGVVEMRHLLVALALLPGLGGGMLLSGRLVHRVDHGLVRPAVLGVAAVAAGLAVLHGLV